MKTLISVTPENEHEVLSGIMEIEGLSFTSPWSMRAFREEIRNPISRVWILVEDDRVWAYICFWMFASEVQVLNIAVHPEKRGHGFGRFLLQRMTQLARSQGVQSAWLEVRVSNQRAQHLYRSFGFKEMGRRRRYYQDTGEDALIMSLRFTQKNEYLKVSNA